MNRLLDVLWLIVAGPLTVVYWVLAFALATLFLRWYFSPNEFACLPIDCRFDFRRLGQNYVTTWRELLGEEPRREI